MVKQHMLPPGMYKEAEETAQQVLNALTNDNVLVDYVALIAAVDAYVSSTPFPAEGIKSFYQKIHNSPPPHSTWGEFLIGIEAMASDIGQTLTLRG